MINTGTSAVNLDMSEHFSGMSDGSPLSAVSTSIRWLMTNDDRCLSGTNRRCHRAGKLLADWKTKFVRLGTFSYEGLDLILFSIILVIEVLLSGFKPIFEANLFTKLSFSHRLFFENWGFLRRVTHFGSHKHLGSIAVLLLIIFSFLSEITTTL